MCLIVVLLCLLWCAVLIWWTGLPHSPKTDRDHLIEDSLGRYCPKTFQTAKGRRKGGATGSWTQGLGLKPPAPLSHDTHWQAPLLLPILFLCSEWLLMSLKLCVWLLHAIVDHERMVSIITAWGVRWTGFPHSPKTNRDRLIEDNLSWSTMARSNHTHNFINSHLEQSNERGSRKGGCQWASWLSGRALRT